MPPRDFRLPATPPSGNAWLPKSTATAISGAPATPTPSRRSPPTGAALSHDAGYVVANAIGPEWLAIDSSGNVWTTGDYNFVNNTLTGLTVELIGAAAPVVTPLSLAIQMGKLGSRP